MDYTMAALKLFTSQLHHAQAWPASSPPALTLHGILFQRAWLQGVLLPSPPDRLLLDDGIGVAELVLPDDFKHREWRPGMYVMVVGACVVRPGGAPPLVKVHKIVDLSPFPDREGMWHLEVIEAFELFYKPGVMLVRVKIESFSSNLPL